MRSYKIWYLVKLSTHDAFYLSSHKRLRIKRSESNRVTVLKAMAMKTEGYGEGSVAMTAIKSSQVEAKVIK